MNSTFFKSFIMLFMTTILVTGCGENPVAKKAEPPVNKRIITEDVNLKDRNITEKSETKVNTQRIDSLLAHYSLAAYPKNNKVVVCSGHGCQYAQSFKFLPGLLSDLKALFRSVNSGDSERDAIRAAIALIEVEVGKVTETGNDKAGFSFLNYGKTHLDTTDEALNVISYLIILRENGMIKFHDIDGPLWKITLASLTQYVVGIKDIKENKLYVIDADHEDNGKPPRILTYPQWYNE